VASTQAPTPTARQRPTGRPTLRVVHGTGGSLARWRRRLRLALTVSSICLLVALDAVLLVGTAVGLTFLVRWAF
jgi:hypothetical protein